MEPFRKLKILFTTSSGPGMSGIIHALKSHPTREIEVVMGDVTDYETGSLLYESDKVKIPYASDKFYIDKMLSICLKHKIDLILSGFSQEILILSKNINKFEEKGINILCPSYENVNICHNKKLMYQKLSNIDSKYLIPYRIANSVDELKKACAELGYPKKKICVKPTICNGGSRGFFILDENYNRYNEFFIEKSSSVCSLMELELKLANIENLPALFVMNYIDGKEYGIDVVAKDGVIASVIRKKPGPHLSNIDMRAFVEENKNIDDFVKEIVSIFHLDSIISMDIIVNERGIYLLEINPRQGALVGVSTQKTNLLALAIDIKYDEIIDLKRYQTDFKSIIGIRFIEEFCICDGKIYIYKR